MSSNSINFGPLNINERCSNLIQVASANTGHSSHNAYFAPKQDAYVEYLGRVTTVLSSHIGSINSVDAANIRKAPEDLMNQIRTDAIHISNKYEIQIEPIPCEWDRFLPSLKSMSQTCEMKCV